MLVTGFAHDPGELHDPGRIVAAPAVMGAGDRRQREAEHESPDDDDDREPGHGARITASPHRASVDANLSTHVLVSLTEVRIDTGLAEADGTGRSLAVENDAEPAVTLLRRSRGDRVLDVVLIGPRDVGARRDRQAARPELEESDRDLGLGRPGRRSSGPPRGHGEDSDQRARRPRQRREPHRPSLLPHDYGWAPLPGLL